MLILIEKSKYIEQGNIIGQILEQVLIYDEKKTDFAYLLNSYLKKQKENAIDFIKEKFKLC